MVPSTLTVSPCVPGQTIDQGCRHPDLVPDTLVGALHHPTRCRRVVTCVLSHHGQARSHAHDGGHGLGDSDTQPFVRLRLRQVLEGKDRHPTGQEPRRRVGLAVLYRLRRGGRAQQPQPEQHAGG